MPATPPSSSDSSSDSSAGTPSPVRKGRNKRCGDQPWVGGIPTQPGEDCWVLRDGVVTKLISRHGLGDTPEVVVVAPHGRTVDPGSFEPGAALGDQTWGGSTSRSLARGGQAKRRGAVVATSTVSRFPHLAERVSAATLSTKSPAAWRVTDDAAASLGADESTTRAVIGLSEDIAARGGRALVVGGAVRDLLVARMRHQSSTIKDIDLEVFGIAPGELRALIESRHQVDVTGASFAVLKVDVGSTHPLDVSIPRRERSTGAGHKDFDVEADPNLSFTEAARRRDFTIGAMGYDPLTGELLDPYGGAADLAAGVLRHVSEAFDEDPLRVLRAARFAARFALSIHPSTAERCRQLRSQAGSLPPERIWGELETTLHQARTPGRALHVLDDVDWIDVFSEVAALRGVAQDETWHPEGDVFTHTAHVLDFWGTHLRTGVAEDDLLVAVAALCHDLGKPMTTSRGSAGSRITAHGHEQAGVAPARALLRGLGQHRLADRVGPLVAHHLAPVQLIAQGAGDKAFARLSTDVDRMDLLALVAKADQGGRPPRDPSEALAACDAFLARAVGLGVDHGAPVSLARGEHLIDLGLRPGPQFKGLLAAAYDAQLDGSITTEAEAVALLTSLVENQQPE